MQFLPSIYTVQLCIINFFSTERIAKYRSLVEQGITDHGRIYLFYFYVQKVCCVCLRNAVITIITNPRIFFSSFSRRNDSHLKAAHGVDLCTFEISPSLRRQFNPLLFTEPPLHQPPKPLTVGPSRWPLLLLLSFPLGIKRSLIYCIEPTDQGCPLGLVYIDIYTQSSII